MPCMPCLLGKCPDPDPCIITIIASNSTLSSNKLTGAIPTEWSALVNLEHLSLAWNRLSGRIPGETFGSWKKMLTLELEWNNFSGNLPVEISAMTDLDSLVIGKNYFSGTLPGAIGDLKSLRNLPNFTPAPHCGLAVTKEIADTFLHPFNAFWPPIPANISAKCNVIATKPFHLPAVVHKTCLGCLWNRCAVGSPCVKKQNIEDPRRNDREECMCECCAEHCKMDPRHIMNHHCAADSQLVRNWANEIRPLGPTEIKLQSEDDSRSYSTLAQHAPVGMTLGVVSALIALAVLAKARGRGREAVSA
ncbi:hypothetical protein T492DRAFT_928348 [Pavlovales sp. CCMP2436]|nr:hypothetical protein T492DRAFT_928348 [Pavlovales sp. CCMP2436]